MVLGGLMISGGATTAGGGALITSGEASIAGGVYLMANTANNKSQGYDRGKKEGHQIKKFMYQKTR